jgi:hypothetical protein
MNLITLRQQSRFKSGITNSATVTTTELNQILNNAYYYLAQIIAEINEDFFEEQKTKFNLGLNSSLYSLPTDCLKVKQIRLAYTAPTDENDYRVANFYDPAEVDDIAEDETDVSTAAPRVDITNNYFRIFPAPTTAVTNGGEIYYIARPSALTLSGDTPIIPIEFHDLMTSYAAKEMCVKFGFYDQHGVYRAEWLEGIETVRRQLAGREINKPSRFRNILETVRGKIVTELWD